MTPVLPFDTALDAAVRKISLARSRHAVDLAEAQGVGTVYGYYLAGAIAPLIYRNARDRLQAEAATSRAHEDLREALETRKPPHLEIVK